MTMSTIETNDEDRLRTIVARGLAPFIAGAVETRRLQVSAATRRLLAELGLVVFLRESTTGCEVLATTLGRNVLRACERVIERRVEVQPIAVTMWPDVLTVGGRLNDRGQSLLDWLRGWYDSEVGRG